MVFQSYAVWPHMKVKDNIAFPLRIRKVPEDEVQRRVRWAAELLQIETLLDRYPHQLSGGQRQGVAVARAIVIEPDVLLMDEPLSNLDALLRVNKMRSELKKLQRRIGVTTIYVTHDRVEAMTMGDKIAVMNAGKIMQVGTPEDIYLRPANTFVGGFVGSPQMNFFDATVTEKDGKLTLEGPGFDIPLSEEQADMLKDYVGKTVIAGIRPEHMFPKDLAPPKLKGIEITGDVDFVEALGSDTIIHLKVGEKILVIKVSGSHHYEVGSKLTIVLDLSKLHVFRKDTNEAIF